MFNLITSLSVKWKVILPVSLILLVAFGMSTYVVIGMPGRGLAVILATQIGALVLVGVAIAVIVHAAVYYPIMRLMRTMGKVERGDLSARARVVAHDEIGRLRERFNQMVEQIEAKNRELARAQEQLAQSEKLASIGLLAAGVAHEINNPLTSISVAAESLLESGANDKERDLARAVGEQAGRISQIVGQLLSFDYSERFEVEPRDVRDVIEEALAPVDVHKIRVSRHYETHLPKVPMDADRLRQAFANIVSNAVDAMGDKGELSVAVRHRGDEVEIVLSDTGPGITADTVRRIFDPFFSTKEVGEGTGLGLAIAYHLIKMHRGEIYVYSPALGEPHSGRGTSFLIRLPEVEGDDGEAGH
ncbi:MAG: HAMP domain-containing protein [Armatimonadota bacterium]|nr:MAG: HAMP domain-containing protein [Armatimonadota bacterium]